MSISVPQIHWSGSSSGYFRVFIHLNPIVLFIMSLNEDLSWQFIINNLKTVTVC